MSGYTKTCKYVKFQNEKKRRKGLQMHERNVAEWMYRVWNLMGEISQLQEELKTEEEKATRVVAAMDKPAVSSSKDPHKYDALADMSRMITELIIKRLRMIADLQEVIESVEDTRCRILLRKRFIECKGWKKISEEMRYSDRQIKRIYQKAMKSIAPAVNEKMSL